MFLLLQASRLSSGETLETLQSCIDPSILSIFEDMPTIEVRLISHSCALTIQVSEYPNRSMMLKLHVVVCLHTIVHVILLYLD